MPVPEPSWLQPTSRLLWGVRAILSATREIGYDDADNTLSVAADEDELETPAQRALLAMLRQAIQIAGEVDEGMPCSLTMRDHRTEHMVHFAWDPHKNEEIEGNPRKAAVSADFKAMILQAVTRGLEK